MSAQLRFQVQYIYIKNYGNTSNKINTYETYIYIYNEIIGFFAVEIFINGDMDIQLLEKSTRNHT